MKTQVDIDILREIPFNDGRSFHCTDGSCVKGAVYIAIKDEYYTDYDYHKPDTAVESNATIDWCDKLSSYKSKKAQRLW